MRKFYKIFVFVCLLFTLTGCLEGKRSNDQLENALLTKDILVYFLDESRYAIGVEPYEAAVLRNIYVDQNTVDGIMLSLFEGPTGEEYADGLRLVDSGCTGYSKVEIEDGVARVYLTGNCRSGGATYTIANLIFVNLKQLPEISCVKIYDQDGETEEPEGGCDSIPFSLEP